MQPEQLSSVYSTYRSYLFAIAYNMLGEVHEAEDVVQDVFEAILQSPSRPIIQPKAYLSRVVVNKCLDRLEHLKREREAYTGPWLPEPLMTESNARESEDVLPYAMLCLLEQLNPLERAAIVLREAFDYDYAEIAGLCNIREDHCRQLLHRAKEKVKRPLKEPRGDDAQRRRLLHAFMQAAFSGNVAALTALLHQDIALYSDGGGKATAATKPLVGAETIAKFFTGFSRKEEAPLVHPEFVVVNGEAAVALKQDGEIIAVFMPQLEAEKVAMLYVMRNPEKIFFSEAVTKE